MTQYANTYPNEVIGVLLIDPLTTAVTSDSHFKEYFSSEKTLSLHLMTASSIFGLNRILNLLGLIPSDLESIANSLPDHEKNLFQEEWNK